MFHSLVFFYQIRPCSTYKEEYSDCTSIKARFHQYFIYGEPIDCSQWKRDYDNCCRFEDNPEDYRSAKELIESEKERRRQRLKAHYGNDVWKKRSSPPEDWDKPLPEELLKKYEGSYLDLRAKEMRDNQGEQRSITEGRTLCVIM